MAGMHAWWTRTVAVIGGHRVISMCVAVSMVCGGIGATFVAMPSDPEPRPYVYVRPRPTVAPTPEATPEPKRTKPPKPTSRPAVRRPVVAAAPPAEVVPASYTSGSPADKVALIIGISNAPGSDPLPGSRTDALTVQKALLKYGFKPGNIRMLLEGQATRGGILAALDDLGNRSKPSGMAVVNITTHSSTNHTMRAWDGRVSAAELASRLGRVKGKLLTMLPTCYSGGYAISGVVGPNRIGVFSSGSDDRSWQVGAAGSWMTRYMVQYGMIDGGAPQSVEAAFNYARKRLLKEYPERAPIMKDGVSGDMKLGPVTWGKPKAEAAATVAVKPRSVSTPAPTPTPTPSSGGGGLGGLLGGLFGR